MSYKPSDTQNEGKGNYTLFGIWLRRLGNSYISNWLYDLFQASSQAMASATATKGPVSMTHSASSGGGGPLSFIGCMREASPPPFDESPPPLPHHHHHNHYHPHHHQQQRHRPIGLPTTGGGELNQMAHGFDSMPKEPKKRRFHPLRGLRRIFRKKSRGAADARLSPGSGGERELNGDHVVSLRDHEEVTLRDPAGRADEIRSRSASELLTETGARDRLFIRRRDIEESFTNNLQRGAAGQLSISHDSVFPGEVSYARPLSSLDMHTNLERRAVNEVDHKETHTPQRHGISGRMLEQMKTVIERRNKIAAASNGTVIGTTTTTTTDNVNLLHNRFVCRNKYERSTSALEDTPAKIPENDSSSVPTIPTTTDTPSSPIKEDLPELPTGSLNHEAAKHRIAVRPKNRRPPLRSNPQPGSLNTSGTSNELPRIDSISEISVDTLDSLETSNSSADVISNNVDPTNPVSPEQEASKPIPILRKSSSRLSRNSEVFEELEAKLPSLRKPPVSPDSLESDSRCSNGFLADVADESSKIGVPPKPTPRTSSTGSEKSSPLPGSTPRRRLSSNQRLSKSPDSLESNSPGWLSKSNEGLFDKHSDLDTTPPAKPVAAARKLLVKPISKSQERVCCSKSSDSLEALNSDDSMERRRSSFEIRPRRQAHKVMSKSTECFDTSLAEQQLRLARAEEKRKRATVSEVNLSRGVGGGLSKPLLSASYEKISGLVDAHRGSVEKNGDSSSEKIATTPTTTAANFWRPSSKRMTHSFESSDNLDLDDNCRLENRNRARRSMPKRLSSSSSGNNVASLDEEVLICKASPRLQKSSESSELGSTDTLDSERRNTMKSSDSDETLDSLEKELQEQPSQKEQDRKDEEITESILERREKSVENEEDNEDPIGPYLRRSQETDSNNLDIHLLAYTLNSRIQENGNNVEEPSSPTIEDNLIDEDKPTKPPRGNSPVVVYPKKKQCQQNSQQQSSSEDNKTLGSFNNQMSAKTTDVDLQNMLNGNISEVSTDTKSFKEKLIMFEKLNKRK